MSHPNVVLRKEIRRLRAALNQQCQRVYAMEGAVLMLTRLLASGVRAVKHASNSIPCSLPGCDLCEWVRRARPQSAAVEWRVGQRIAQTHGLEAHLGPEGP